MGQAAKIGAKRKSGPGLQYCNLTSGGQGLRSVVVTLVDSNGVRLTAATSSFGAYEFDAVLGGQTVTLSVASKRYRFAPRVVAISTSLSNVDFVGLE